MIIYIKNDNLFIYICLKNMNSIDNSENEMYQFPQKYEAV